MVSAEAAHNHPRPCQTKIIGIVGGLGPFAHLDFEQKLLESAQVLVGASSDQDYPEWILSSVPQTPDRTLAIQGQASDPVPWLLRSLRRLEGPCSGEDDATPGADFAVIPCNTAHYYLPQLQGAVKIPILNMIEETALRIRQVHEKACVGILATTGTLESGLYHDVLRAQGLHPVSLFDLPGGVALQERLVMEAVYGPAQQGRRAGGGIKAAGKRPEFSLALEEASRMLINACGAHVIVAACTEIPIALDCYSIGQIPMLDPTRILAEAAIRHAYDL